MAEELRGEEGRKRCYRLSATSLIQTCRTLVTSFIDLVFDIECFRVSFKVVLYVLLLI